MAITLSRSSSDQDIKDAYDKGIAPARIAELTERTTEYVLGLTYVDGDNADGTTVEDEILAANNQPAAKK